jgi:hypothetical protein
MTIRDSLRTCGLVGRHRRLAYIVGSRMLRLGFMRSDGLMQGWRYQDCVDDRQVVCRFSTPRVRIMPYGRPRFSYSGVRAPRVQIDELLPCWRTALRCSRATWSFPYVGFPRQTASAPPQVGSVLLHRAARRRGRIHSVRCCCSWCPQTSRVETLTSLASSSRSASSGWPVSCLDVRQNDLFFTNQCFDRLGGRSIASASAVD